MNKENYIDLHQPTDLIEFHSHTYGLYYMRKIGSVNMLQSLDNTKLKECADAWSILASSIYGTYHTIEINSRQINEYTKIEDFDIYIPFSADNKKWKDPKKYLKRLPMGLTVKQFDKILVKLTKLNIG